MKVERFTCGLFQNCGYKTVYSPRAKKLLKKESLEILRNLRLKKGQLTDVVTMHFPSEDVVTRSYLTATNDVYGRDGCINRTFIMSIHDLFNTFPEVLDNPFNSINQIFHILTINADTKQLDSVNLGNDAE